MDIEGLHFFAQEVGQLDCPAAVWAATCRYMAKLGMDGVFYADISPKAQTVLCNVNPSWLDQYAQERYVDVDPFFRRCCRDLNLMITGADFLDRFPYLSSSERHFILAASETGFRAGIAVPFRPIGSNGVGGWHLLSTGGKDVVADVYAQHRQDVHLLCLIAHTRINDLSVNAPEAAGRLTSRERECLSWLTAGLRNKEIATRLGIQPVTVELHLTNARRKLGARTREEAVAKAVAANCISL